MTAHPRRGLIGNSEANTSKGGMLTMNSNLGYFNGIGQEFLNIPVVGETLGYTGLLNTRSFHVSHNGKYLFAVVADSGTGPDYIRRFPLSTPYDVTTRSSSGDQTWQVHYYGESDPRVMRWSNDGYYLYISGSADDNITQWHANTPWDLGDSSNPLKLGGREVYKATQVSRCDDIAFSSDGTKMFLLDSSSDNIDQYTLSTAFDISTASNHKVRDISGQVSTPIGFGFSNDGNSVFILDFSGPEIVKYNLGSSWDVDDSGWEHDSSFTLTNGPSAPYGFTFDQNSLTFYITTSSIYTYTINSSLAVNTIAYDTIESSPSGHFSGLGSAEPIKAIKFNSDGSQVILWGNTDNVLFVAPLSTPYDLSSLSGLYGRVIRTDSSSIPDEANSQYTYQIDTAGGIYVTDNHVYLTDRDTTLGTNQGNVHQFKLLVSDDLESIHTGIHNYQPSENGKFQSDSDLCMDFRFSNDGKKFIVLNYTQGRLYHYTCNIPWMICTSNFASTNNQLAYDGYTDISNFTADLPYVALIAADGKTVFTSSSNSSDGYPFSQFKLDSEFAVSNYNKSWSTSAISRYIFDTSISYIKDAQFSSDGQYLYVWKDNDEIIQFNLQTY